MNESSIPFMTGVPTAVRLVPTPWNLYTFYRVRNSRAKMLLLMQLLQNPTFPEVYASPVVAA
jgi:hypothetical protein